MAIEADSGQYTDATLDMRKRLAMALIKNGADTSPISSHWQGLARLANALAGGYAMHKIEENKKSQDQAVTGALLGDAPGGWASGGGNVTKPTQPPITATPDAAPTSGKAPKFSGNIDGLIDQHAKEIGVDPSHLRAFVQIESGGNPLNVTGSYMGLGQLSPDEFKKHGGKGNILDPSENLRVTAIKMKAENEDFKRQYGRDATPGELYMIHQQGVGGAAAHAANPDQPAWQSMASTGEGRQKGAAWAKRAIWGNIPDSEKARFGSVENVTSGDFQKLWGDRIARLIPAAQAAPGAAPAVAPVQVAQAPSATLTDAPAGPAALPPPPPAAAVPAVQPSQQVAQPDAVDSGQPAFPPRPAPVDPMAQAQAIARHQQAEPAITPQIRAYLQHPSPQVQAIGRQMAMDAIARANKGMSPQDVAALADKIASARKHTVEADVAEQDRKPTPVELSNKVRRGLESLAQVPEEYGKTATERALGPYSGANTHENKAGYIGAIMTSLPQALARAWGEYRTFADGGANPTEIRRRVEGDTQALVTMLKPYLRVKGEGNQSNFELQQLQDTLGSAMTARTVEEYNRALEAARLRISNIIGFEIPTLRAQTRSSASPLTAEEQQAQVKAAQVQPAGPWATQAQPAPIDEMTLDPREQLLRTLLLQAQAGVR